jgi:nitrogen regulatory protein P-II 1
MNAHAGDDDLWMVQAVIQPFRLDAVTLALKGISCFGGMTVSDCRGFGREKLRSDTAGVMDSNRITTRAEGVVDFTSKLLVAVVVVGHSHADEIVDTIVRAAHTGNRGDGKVFAWPLARAVRVRTLEENAKAI